MRSESDVKDDHQIKSFLTSFYHAASGLLTACKIGRNIKVHYLVSCFVIWCGFYLNITRVEWMILILTMSQVMITEMINSAIEFAVDLASPRYHLFAKLAKDIAAGAVLLSAMTSVIMGIIIFLPYLQMLR